jgi:hypothetical protein
MFGPVQAPPFDRARRLVAAYTAGTAEQIDAVARHIAATGDCVFHACAVVTGRRCPCYACTGVAVNPEPR